MVYRSLLLIFLSVAVFADTGFYSTIGVTEVDGSPKCQAGQIKFSNGSVSCSGQTATVTTSGSGGGGGYAVEPATVTFNLAKGFTASTGTVTGGFTSTGGVITSTAIYVSSATIYQNSYVNGNTSTAQTIDWTHSNIQYSTATGNVTFTFTDPPSPRSAILHLCIWTGSGSFTAAWPANVKWPGSVAPVLTTTANKDDCFDFRYIAEGGKYLGDFDQNY